MTTRTRPVPPTASTAKITDHHTKHNAGPLIGTTKTDVIRVARSKYASPSKPLTGPDGPPVDLSKFTYIKSCGTGTFGEVGLFEYDAGDGTPKQRVAIKKVFQNPNYKNREFQIQVRLDHANLVKILVPSGIYTSSRSQSNGNYLHIVMECFDKSMYQVIHRSRKDERELNHRKIRSYLKQILEGLSYMGRRHISHRDLKPENLLLKAEKNPKTGAETTRVAICDFGNAKVLTRDEESICYICTRMYRAPELVYGAVKYSTAVDIWSIGCIAAEMALTTPAFGMTMENVSERGDQPDMKPLPLWKDFAIALGMPTDRDWNDMRVPKGAKQHYMGQAKNEHSNEQPLLSGIGLKRVFQKIHAESVAQDKAKINRETGLPVPFRELFPPTFLDLVSKLLVYSPIGRLTAQEALKHPYFKEEY